MRIVLENRQTFQQPRATAVHEHRRANVRVWVAEALQNFRPPVDAVAVRGAQNRENSNMSTPTLLRISSHGLTNAVANIFGLRKSRLVCPAFTPKRGRLGKFSTVIASVTLKPI